MLEYSSAQQPVQNDLHIKIFGGTYRVVLLSNERSISTTTLNAAD
jgi:hypothetical protein